MSGPSHDNPGEPAAARHVPPPVPNLDLLRRIGRGSYGEVWLALNALAQWTAVKVVYRNPADGGRAYEQELRGLRRYEEHAGQDESLLPIKNVGRNEEAGYFHYAMELADNAVTRAPLPKLAAIGNHRTEALAVAENYQPWTLNEELKMRQRLPPQECIAHGIALASTLEHLHSRGLVHRDVKPSNIIFVNGRPKLADIGLVAASDATFISFAGTSGFVPLHGAGEATGDIFALGKVLYLMASGQSLTNYLEEPSGAELRDEQERKEFTELQAVFDRACDPSPEERQPSAKVLREELELLRRNESVLRLRELEAERKESQRRRKRNTKVAVAVGLVLILAVIGLGFNLWRLSNAHQTAVAQLRSGQLSRMLVRSAGWSQADWQHIEMAAKRNLDDQVMGQAVSILSGLDARTIGEWPNAEASSAAFAPDGRALLAGFGTNRAMLLTDATNRIDLAVAGEGKACWDSDGEPLILQVATQACVLREARSGDVRREFRLGSGEEVAIGNSPALAVALDGSLAAAATTGTNGARVVLWNARDGRVVGEASGTFRALSFSPDGSLLAAGDELGKNIIWSVSPFAQLAELQPAKRPNPINCLAFGEDRVVPHAGPGEAKRWLLAVGDSGAGIVVWDLTRRLPRAFCPASDYNTQSLAISPDGLTLASAGRGGVRVWDLMSGGQLLWITGLGNSDTPALAFDATGRRLVVGANALSSPSTVGIVELEPHRGIQSLRGLNSRVRKVWISPNSRLIAAQTDDWSLAVWETESGRLRHLFEAPAGLLGDNSGGAFDATGKRFGFAAGLAARLYDLESERTLEQWSLPHGYGEAVQFDDKGRLLLVRRQRSPEFPNTWRWTLYELPPGREATVLHQQMDFSYRTISLTFSPAASQFVAVTKDRATGSNSVRAIEVVSGSQRWQFAQRKSTPWDEVRMSADGKWCAISVGDSIDRQFVRATDGTLGFFSAADCKAIGRDGREYVALPSGRKSQWTLQTTRSATAPIHFGFDGQEDGDTFTFSPDGRYLGWGTADGTVLLAEISVVRARLAILRH